MRYTTVTPSSHQDDTAQKPNASIREHCREVLLQLNRGHECLWLTTIGKFYFGNEKAMSVYDVKERSTCIQHASIVMILDENIESLNKISPGLNATNNEPLSCEKTCRTHTNTITNSHYITLNLMPLD